MKYLRYIPYIISVSVIISSLLLTIVILSAEIFILEPLKEWWYARKFKKQWLKEKKYRDFHINCVALGNSQKGGTKP